MIELGVERAAASARIIKSQNARGKFTDGLSNSTICVIRSQDYIAARGFVPTEYLGRSLVAQCWPRGVVNEVS